MNFNWRDHIVRDPAICGGLPTMKGTRVLLRQVLADLATGASFAEIIRSYPTLREDHLRAAVAFAAGAAMEDIPLIDASAA
jgi:uncharacterized protein (DUF433 family)